MALESVKSAGFWAVKENFLFQIALPPDAKRELQWWMNNVETATSPITWGSPDKIAQSEASLLGWGAACEGITTGGRWSKEESTQHINIFELQAALFALQSPCKHDSNTNIEI